MNFNPDFKSTPLFDVSIIIIINIANNVLYITAKSYKASTLTGRNVRLSDLLISFSYHYGDTVRSALVLSGIIPVGTAHAQYCSKWW